MNLRRLSQEFVVRIAVVLAALLAYSFILLLPLPRQLGLTFRYEFSSVLAVSALLLFVAYALHGWLGTLLALVATLFLFALPLSGLWASGSSEPNILLGLLPWSDAANYYIDAGRLLDGGVFSEFSARRPIFAGLLAVLLGIGGRNLQLALALLTLMTALSCYVLARQVQRIAGTLPAVMLLLIVFVFYRRFIGTTLTEHAGLTLGALALALLLYAARARDRWMAALGVLLLTLALNARAGAFLVLPVLVLWMGWHFRTGHLFSWRTFALGLAAVLVGFGANFLLWKVLATPHSAGFGNFSYTFYGLVVGSKSWEQILIDHPELNIIGEPEKTQRIYALAMQALRADPMQFVRSVLAAWEAFFNLKSKICAYCFFSGGDLVIYGALLGGNMTVYLAARVVLYVLALLVMVDSLRCWRKDNSTLTLALCLGILLSVPFVPPWDADRMRAYAATIPALALFPALGFALVVQYATALLKPRLMRSGIFPGWMNKQQAELDDSALQVRTMKMFSLGVLTLMVVGPLVIRGFGRPPVVSPTGCPPGLEGIVARVERGAYVNVVRSDEAERTWLPDVRYHQFVQSIHDFPEYHLTLELEREVAAPAALVFTRNIENNTPVWLLIRDALLQGDPGMLLFCAERAKSPQVAGVGLFYVDSFKEIASQ